MLAMPDCRGWYRAWAISQFTSMAETREGADAVIAELETNIARMEAAQERSAWSITLAVRYAVLGAVYESLDRTEEAILAFRRASELAPADPEHAANARRVQAGRDRVHQQVQAVLGDATILWKRRDPVTPARWWIGAQDTVLTLNADTAERTIWRGLLGHERFTPRGVAFDKDRVWLATDRGLFVHAREHQYWGLVPLPDAAQGSDVTEVRLKDPDRFVVKVRSEDGQEREIEGQRPGVRP
jgi:hypothetical protein